MPELTTKRKPTQADVARRAAVSQAMVTYVLNDHPRVSIPSETRRRILDAVEELGYVPNSAARSLRTRKTMTIAAIIPDITNPYYPAFNRGIQDVAESRDFDVVTYNTDGDLAKERKAIRSLQQGRVDGAIFNLIHLGPEDLRPLVEMGLAAVVMARIDLLWTESGVDMLIVDNASAARAAVGYLIDRGHTRIGMVAGIVGTPPREGRVEGYRQALADHHPPRSRKPGSFSSPTRTRNGARRTSGSLARCSITPPARRRSMKPSPARQNGPILRLSMP
ncbi:MAG: LacI family transcriptional regulator [Thermomicrobiales bacterium]|jgi:LacI family transcriptional regulator|nr:LacI family transcriptional regulator [Thermomicrobiales bacterium]